MGKATPTLDGGLRQVSIADAQGPYRIPGADNEPERPTYRACKYGMAPAGAVSDLVLLIGASDKVIRLKQISIGGVATTATNVRIDLLKRSTVDTGGTPAVWTAVPCDSADPAASGIARDYAGGTPGALGTLVGAFDNIRINLGPASAGSADRVYFQYTWQNDKAIVLRSAAECIAINLAGATLPAGGAVDVQITWTEEELRV